MAKTSVQSSESKARKTFTFGLGFRSREKDRTLNVHLLGTHKVLPHRIASSTSIEEARAILDIHSPVNGKFILSRLLVCKAL